MCIYSTKGCSMVFPWFSMVFHSMTQWKSLQNQPILHSRDPWGLWPSSILHTSRRVALRLLGFIENHWLGAFNDVILYDIWWYNMNDDNMCIYIYTHNTVYNNDIYYDIVCHPCLRCWPMNRGIPQHLKTWGNWVLSWDKGWELRAWTRRFALGEDIIDIESCLVELHLFQRQ